MFNMRKKVLVTALGLVLSACATTHHPPVPAPLPLRVGVTPDMAEKLVRYRQGDDGIDGTDDDKPFQAADEIATVYAFCEDVGLPTTLAEVGVRNADIRSGVDRRG